MTIKKELSVEARICRENNKLNKIFSEIDSDKKKTIQKLIQNASFMAIQMEDLQSEIIKNGVITKYQHGENQWGYKKSPAVETYNAFIRQYRAIISQLVSLLPKSEVDEFDDGFEEFINSR